MKTTIPIQHTPGPWTAEHVRDKYTGHKMWGVFAANGFVAYIPEDRCEGVQDKANARLIKAAPRMLNALRGILANFHESVRTAEALESFPALKEVADAIKEAEGL
jgi:hypothetical protein